ncbi:hypothetical protein AgCh_022542 [Apium graveolens]
MTKICGHLWLNDDTNLYITSDVQGLDQATIASLLTMEGHQLDVEIIEDLFNQRDQLCIAHSPTLSTKKTILNAKQVSISVMCLICNGEVETILHAIATNNMLWNQKKSEVWGVVNSTKRCLADWRKAQIDGAISWVKSQTDIVKITVDATTFTESSKYGIGMLSRDDEWEVIQGRSSLFEGNVRPEFAEAIAVKEALSWVKSKDWRKIEIESDCLAVIQAIRRSYFFPNRVFDRRSVPVELESIPLNDLFE